MRWSLAGKSATKLAEYKTPENWEILELSYMADGRESYDGGVSGALPENLVVMEQPNPEGKSHGVCVLEFRHWDDFRLIRTLTLTNSYCGLVWLNTSPDGRWIVAVTGEVIYLINYETNKISHFKANANRTSGLTFDFSSSYLSDVSGSDGGGQLTLWQIEQAELDSVPLLTKRYRALDRYGVGSKSSLADPEGATAFTPDGKVVIYSVRSGYSRAPLDLSAYEVATGQRIWATQGDDDFSGRFILSPDGRHLIGPTWQGDLLVFRTATGKLEKRIPTGVSETIRAIAFDNDDATLWLATDNSLIRYDPQR